MHPMKKIYKLETLANSLREKLDMSTVVGLCHGCWDILHIGHIRHLKSAKSECNILVVTVTSDRFVNKGSGRPTFPAEIRAEVVAALSCVDFVAINDDETAVKAIHLLRPDFYFKGMEFKGNINPALASEIDEVANCNGSIQLIGEKLASSTQLAGRLS